MAAVSLAPQSQHDRVVPNVGYIPHASGKTTCFAHRHLTMEEYGLWTHACQLAHESGIFYFDGRSIAHRFSDTGKNAVYRVGKNLIRKGWLEIVRPPKRLKNGMFSAGQYRPVSHLQWAVEHPGACPEIGTGGDDTSPEIENDLSRNQERPVPKSGHNIKGLSIKGEYQDEGTALNNSKAHRGIEDEGDLNQTSEDPDQPHSSSLSSSSQRVDFKKDMSAAPDQPAIVAAPDDNAVVERVFKYYLAVTGKEPAINTLTATRRRLGKARLHECLARVNGNYEKAELIMKLAIDNIVASDWAMGRDPKTKGVRYCDWERHIFKTEESMERLWN